MATFLLISFAVAIGVVVMNFGRAQVEQQAECAIDINLKFSKISNQDQICYDASKKDITFTIENGINIKVDGLILNTIGSQKADSLELNDAKIGKAGVYLGHMKYDKAVSGDMKQLKITPKVTMYDQEQICTEKALVVENLRAC
mgnify:CR=1 FL=1